VVKGAKPEQVGSITGTTCNYFEADICPEGVPRYLVSTLYYGGQDLEHLDCYRRLRDWYPELQGCGFRVAGCAYIDIGRATAAQQAIEGGFDGIFFIDHDIIFDPREVVGMMRAAESVQAPVIGLYGMRASGKRMIGAFHESVVRDAEQQHGRPVLCFQEGGLYRGKDGGLGFAAIPRKVLETVGRDMAMLDTGFSKVKALFALRSAMPDWPELFEALMAAGMLSGLDEQQQPITLEKFRERFGSIVEQLGHGWYAGEDMSFWRRVERAGIPIYVDTRPRLGHKGTYRYGLEDVQIVVPRAETLKLHLVEIDDPHDVEQQNKLYAAAAQFEGRDGKPLPGPVLHKTQAAE
jgi:hypothetical protein